MDIWALSTFISELISYLNVGNVKEQCWPYTSQLEFTCLLMVSSHHIVVLEGFLERISLAHYPESEELEKASPKKSVYLKSLGISLIVFRSRTRSSSTRSCEHNI